MAAASAPSGPREPLPPIPVTLPMSEWPLAGERVILEHGVRMRVVPSDPAFRATAETDAAYDAFHWIGLWHMDYPSRLEAERVFAVLRKSCARVRSSTH
jgi:hypothetical protein